MIRRDFQLILRCAAASGLSGEWNDDDFDVLYNGVVVGRIMKAMAAPVGSPWMQTLAFGYHEDRTPPRLRADSREVREELAAGMATPLVIQPTATVHGTKHRPWLTALLARPPTKVCRDRACQQDREDGVGHDGER